MQKTYSIFHNFLGETVNTYSLGSKQPNEMQPDSIGGDIVVFGRKEYDRQARESMPNTLDMNSRSAQEVARVAPIYPIQETATYESIDEIEQFTAQIPDSTKVCDFGRRYQGRVLNMRHHAIQNGEIHRMAA